MTTGYALDHWWNPATHTGLAHDATASYALENGQWKRLYYVTPSWTWSDADQGWLSDQGYDDGGNPITLYSTDPAAGPPVIPHEDSIGTDFLDTVVQAAAFSFPLLALGSVAGASITETATLPAMPLDTVSATLTATTPEVSAAIPETVITPTVESAIPLDLPPVPESVITPTFPEGTLPPTDLPQLPSVQDALKYAQGAAKLLLKPSPPTLPHQVAHRSLTPTLPGEGEPAKVTYIVSGAIGLGLLLAFLKG